MKKGGFTLIEILVAIALSCLVLVILSVALRMGYGAVGRGKERSRLFQEVRGTENLLRRQLLNLYAGAVMNGGERPYFRGTEEELVFITKAPVEGLYPGGLAIVSYYVRGGALYLYQKPYTRREDLLRPREGGREVKLIKGVSNFKIRYLEDLEWDEGFEEEWEDHWEEEDLPLGVEVSIRVGNFGGRCFVSLSQEG